MYKNCLFHGSTLLYLKLLSQLNVVLHKEGTAFVLPFDDSTDPFGQADSISLLIPQLLSYNLNPIEAAFPVREKYVLF